MSNKINKLIYSLIAIASVGVIDATYLTVKHYKGSIDCSIISGCQEVLNSSYSEIMGIPLALLGVFYYISVIFLALLYIDTKKEKILKLLKYYPIFGFVFSMWLVYLQIFEIGAICQYCMLSALSSTTLFVVALFIKNKTTETIKNE